MRGAVGDFWNARDLCCWGGAGRRWRTFISPPCLPLVVSAPSRVTFPFGSVWRWTETAFKFPPEFSNLLLCFLFHLYVLAGRKIRGITWIVWIWSPVVFLLLFVPLHRSASGFLRPKASHLSEVVRPCQASWGPHAAFFSSRRTLNWWGHLTRGRRGGVEGANKQPFPGQQPLWPSEISPGLKLQVGKGPGVLKGPGRQLWGLIYVVCDHQWLSSCALLCLCASVEIYLGKEVFLRLKYAKLANFLPWGGGIGRQSQWFLLPLLWILPSDQRPQPLTCLPPTHPPSRCLAPTSSDSAIFHLRIGNLHLLYQSRSMKTRNNNKEWIFAGLYCPFQSFFNSQKLGLCCCQEIHPIYFFFMLSC